MRSLAVFLIACTSALGLAACGSEPAAPPATPPAAVAPAKVAAAQPVAIVAPEAEPAAAQAAFAYNAEDLRDPFQPFLKLEEKKPQVRPQVFVPKTPLQRFAVEELRLVGIIWGDGGRSRALIEDPEGKGYVVGTGILVGDRGGRIVRIQREEAVVEERTVDLFGEESVKVVRMTLRKPEDEVNP